MVRPHAEIIFNLLGGHMKTTPYIALAATALIAISGCTPPPTNVSVPLAIDQSDLCEVKIWRHDDVASVCKPGQKVIFLPSSWGNEQLPILFAAVNCDLRFSVALTPGAVTCIYGPITPTPPEPEPKPVEKDASKP